MESGASTTLTAKKQKTVKRSGLAGNHGKSPVWDHFIKHLDERTNKYTGIAECKHCHEKIDAPSFMGTNKLWNHINKRCKPVPHDELDISKSLIHFTGGGAITAVTSKKRKTDNKSGLAGNHGKSPVWDHFIKHLDESTNKYTGIAECKHCHEKIDAPSFMGTNKLWNHINKCCKPVPTVELDAAQSIIHFMGGQASNWRVDQEICRRSLARMIILCELPFTLVEKEAFREFCQDMQPKFHACCRTTVTKDCYQIFDDERKKLKSYLNGTSARVCIALDIWTSIQNLRYMVITAHFIDKDWSLKKKIINFRVIPYPHKGEVVAKALEGCLLEWGIDKVMTVTLANIKNNDACVLDLRKRLNNRNMLLLGGEFLHVRCFAHVINLVVRDGIDHIKATIKRLRRSVKYVRSSPSRLQMFKKCAWEENIISTRVVGLDVKTRWNSTYLMIDTALEFEKAFHRLEEQDPSYKNEFQVMGLMEEFDWKSLRSLHEFLEEFYLLTNRISGSQYITVNTYFEDVANIKHILMREMSSDDVYRSTMAMKMNEKFDKYCDFDSINQVLVVALVLDPRYKIEFLVLWYNSILAHDSILSEESKKAKVEMFVDDLKILMSRLYDHYNAEATSFMDIQGNKLDSDVAKGPIDKVKSLSKKDELRAILKRKDHVDASNDLEKYLSEGREDDDPDFDVLGWWKGKLATYRALAIMARDILAIPLTSVASEYAFSTAGRVLDPFRSSLTPKLVECLVCAQDWIRSSSSSDDVELTLEAIEELESVVVKDFEGLSVEAHS